MRNKSLGKHCSITCKHPKTVIAAGNFKRRLELCIIVVIDCYNVQGEFKLWYKKDLQRQRRATEINLPVILLFCSASMRKDDVGAKVGLI